MTELAVSSTIRVQSWPDPVIDELGHDPRSDYVERYWLGLLGPTATWLVRRLADRLEYEPEGFDLDLGAMAAELGVGHRTGRHAPIARTLQRCARFGVIDLSPDALRVRRRLPPLTSFQAERLPAHLRAELRPAPAGPHGLTIGELRERARGFALSLLGRGLPPTDVERELHRRAIHPALAHEVVGWAVQHAEATHAEGRPVGGPAAAPAPLPPAA